MNGERDSDATGGEPPADGPSGPVADAEERYRRVFRHGNDAVMVVDLETEAFLDVNPAACDLLGYSREELLSMHPEEVHPNDAERVREEFVSQVVEEGAGFTEDLTCLTKDGREVPTEVSGAALAPDEGGDGEPSRMIAMLRDVSDRVERRRELEEKVERLDRFASVVSHDLRNPLSVVRGRAALARETGDPEHFDAIEDAVDRMDDMLADLLRLARQGDVIDETRAVDLEAVARRAWTGDGPAGTLEVADTRTVDADPDRLSELFENLFENALEHGGEGVAVRVGTLPDGAGEGFYVADDGPGVPPDERADVFEWGYTTSAEGTGFGLAIVAEIADAHGWDVDVAESEAGGARFEVTGVETG